jgi:hypothetical protein
MKYFILQIKKIINKLLKNKSSSITAQSNQPSCSKLIADRSTKRRAQRSKSSHRAPVRSCSRLPPPPRGPSPLAGHVAGGRRVTISSMSCCGVKAFVPFQKPPLYAAVSLAGRREKTPPDAGSGENPDWEGTVAAFDLDDGDAGREQVVRFEVKAQVPLLRTKVVTASVPIAYLAAFDAAARQLPGEGPGRQAQRRAQLRVRHRRLWRPP